MATILEIKQDNNDNIRIKTAPGSITKEVDANMRDVVAGELRDRGVLRAANTEVLAAISTQNTRAVLVVDVGFFEALQTVTAPDDENTFASADAGWVWTKVATFATVDLKDKFTIEGEDTYQLADGYLIDKMMIKPSVEEVARVGLEMGGEEIMMEDTLPANEWRAITRDVVADGEAITIFFGGFTGPATIIIYKRKI